MPTTAMKREATCHPLGDGAYLSSEYGVEVDGRPITVYGLPGMAGGTSSFASFVWDGKAEVRVTAAWTPDTVSVHPVSRGVPAALSGKTARFALAGPGAYFVKWNDRFELPLYLFADPPRAVPRGGGVVRFPPGVHDAGLIRLESGQTLYLAPGAWVRGTVLAWDAERVRICGRGVLCASHLPFYRGDGVSTEMAGFKRCRRVRMEDVTLLDPFGWTVAAYDCDDVRLDNVKIIAERPYSTDGINPVNCRDVRIERCFVRSKDDCVAVKGLDHPARLPIARTPIRDILVRDCVFWSDNNNGVVIGCETAAESIRNVVFRDIDFLKTSNTCGDAAGALSVVALHDTEIEDIVFENIRIEHATGPLFNLAMPDVLFGDIGGDRTRGRAAMRRIVFRNVVAPAGRPRPSFLLGRDGNRRIEGVCFENLRFGDRRIKTARAARIVGNEFADRPIFR